jgi:hypothetical protein
MSRLSRPVLAPARLTPTGGAVDAPGWPASPVTCCWDLLRQQVLPHRRLPGQSRNRGLYADHPCSHRCVSAAQDRKDPPPPPEPVSPGGQCCRGSEEPIAGRVRRLIPRVSAFHPGHMSQPRHSNTECVTPRSVLAVALTGVLRAWIPNARCCAVRCPEPAATPAYQAESANRRGTMTPCTPRPPAGVVIMGGLRLRWLVGWAFRWSG